MGRTPPKTFKWHQNPLWFIVYPSLLLPHSFVFEGFSDKKHTTQFTLKVLKETMKKKNCHFISRMATCCNFSAASTAAQQWRRPLHQRTNSSQFKLWSPDCRWHTQKKKKITAEVAILTSHFCLLTSSLMWLSSVSQEWTECAARASRRSESEGPCCAAVRARAHWCGPPSRAEVHAARAGTTQVCVQRSHL